MEHPADPAGASTYASLSQAAQLRTQAKSSVLLQALTSRRNSASLDPYWPRRFWRDGRLSIPDSTGAIVDNRELIRPVEWKQEGEVVVKAVLDDSHEALTNLDRHGLSIGTVLTAKHLAQLPNEMKAQLLVAPHHSNH